jgi:uncharacterized protein YbcV (DUF1398 family)
LSTSPESVAQSCLHGAESGALTFPEIVGTLIAAGFDGYAVDLRRAVATYYLPNGDSVVVDASRPKTAVSERFVGALIREAQTNAPGYTYSGFCDKVAGAGCAGYVVSFPGRRVLYYGRTGEAHTEHFPGAD